LFIGPGEPVSIPFDIANIHKGKWGFKKEKHIFLGIFLVGAWGKKHKIVVNIGVWIYTSICSFFNFVACS